MPNTKNCCNRQNGAFFLIQQRRRLSPRYTLPRLPLRPMSAFRLPPAHSAAYPAPRPLRTPQDRQTPPTLLPKVSLSLPFSVSSFFLPLPVIFRRSYPPSCSYYITLFSHLQHIFVFYHSLLYLFGISGISLRFIHEFMQSPPRRSFRSGGAGFTVSFSKRAARRLRGRRSR